MVHNFYGIPLNRSWFTDPGQKNLVLEEFLEKCPIDPRDFSYMIRYPSKCELIYECVEVSQFFKLACIVSNLSNNYQASADIFRDTGDSFSPTSFQRFLILAEHLRMTDYFDKLYTYIINTVYIIPNFTVIPVDCILKLFDVYIFQNISFLRSFVLKNQEVLPRLNLRLKISIPNLAYFSEDSEFRKNYRENTYYEWLELLPTFKEIIITDADEWLKLMPDVTGQPTPIYDLVSFAKNHIESRVVCTTYRDGQKTKNYTIPKRKKFHTKILHQILKRVTTTKIIWVAINWPQINPNYYQDWLFVRTCRKIRLIACSIPGILLEYMVEHGVLEDIKMRCSKVKGKFFRRKLPAQIKRLVFTNCECRVRTLINEKYPEITPFTQINYHHVFVPTIESLIICDDYTARLPDPRKLYELYIGDCSTFQFNVLGVDWITDIKQLHEVYNYYLASKVNKLLSKQSINFVYKQFWGVTPLCLATVEDAIIYSDRKKDISNKFYEQHRDRHNWIILMTDNIE